jgi:hypothetical protein
MPLDPKPVPAVFPEAVPYLDPEEREVILHRGCGEDGELRRRVEALLRARSQFDDFGNQPIVGPAIRPRWWFT